MGDKLAGTFYVQTAAEPGAKGSRGMLPFPAGEYSSSKTYTATEHVTPYVLLDGTYYVMNKVGSWLGSSAGKTPAQDYAANGTSATWIPFESFKAIYVELLLARFGMLGSAVFYDEYMFSQHGVDASGNESSDYAGFASGAFTPNILLNFKTGEGHLAGGKISWDKNGRPILAGIIRLSTSYSGNVSDDNIFYLPAQTNEITLSMGYEAEDVGKVVRLFNSGSYTNADYRIALRTFGISDTMTDSTLGTVYALLKPQEVIELTCYELPPSKFNNVYPIVGKWYISSRFSQDQFKKADAIGRFPRMLALGRVYGTSTGATISYTFYDGRTSGVFSVSRVTTGQYRITWASGVIPAGYHVQLTGHGYASGTSGPLKGTLVSQNLTSFDIVVSDDDTNNDGNCNFMILAPSWEYDLPNI